MNLQWHYTPQSGMRATNPQQVPCSFRLLRFQGKVDKPLWTLTIRFLSFRQQVYKQIIINDFRNLWSNKDDLLNLASLGFGNVSLKHSKLLTCFFYIVLTKFFINPNLMCSGGNKILAVDFWHTFPLEMSFLAWANP